jgi:hypothetical protein
MSPCARMRTFCRNDEYEEDTYVDAVGILEEQEEEQEEDNEQCVIDEDSIEQYKENTTEINVNETDDLKQFTQQMDGMMG